MDFLDLNEILRQIVKGRITAGDITGAELARRIGLAQSTMSNYLSGKITLSDENRSRICRVLKISVEQIVASKLTSIPPKGSPIPLVRQLTAIEQALIAPPMVLDSIQMKIPAPKYKLGDEINPRPTWTRFVAIRVTRAQARFMHPLFSDNTIVVLDRHYQKLGGRFRGLPAVYAVAEGKDLRIGYLRQVGHQLELHPDLNRSHPLLITLSPARHTTHSIVGRVCKILKDI